MINTVAITASNISFVGSLVCSLGNKYSLKNATITIIGMNEKNPIIIKIGSNTRLSND